MFQTEIKHSIAIGFSEARGKTLLTRYAIFKNALERADQRIKKLGAEYSIVSMLSCWTGQITHVGRVLTILGEITREGESALFTNPCYSQSSCAAIQLSLTQLLKSWDVIPTTVVGHSSGEIAAAFTAAMLDFDDCMRIAYCRGAVAEKLRTTDVRGSMMAIGTCKEDAEEMIKQAHSGTLSSPASTET